MSEDFLHYLWQNRLFAEQLTTTDGDPITIISTGFHNHNSGPDFSDARLTIGDTTWAGNVEIHINTSDWFKHGHQLDEAYNNVVLHVVYNNDVIKSDSVMPVCELAGRIDIELFEAYKRFIERNEFVPCSSKISEVSELDRSFWLERMLIEKLELKADFMQDALTVSQNDWEEALYHIIARSFGFSVNALPFEMLARSVSYQILARHSDNLFQIEALLFGQAGMLSHDLIDIYGQELFKEYSYLRKKYKLVPMSDSLWKFMRMRPVNFPTIRISQFACFINRNAGLMSKLISLDTVQEMMALFQVNASEYWNNHYVFDKESTIKNVSDKESLKKNLSDEKTSHQHISNKESSSKPKHLGKDAAQLLIINAVLPFMFNYGSATGNDQLSNRALSMFEALPGERNSVISGWTVAGLKADTAWSTQALMHLKMQYCDKRACLNCRIGNLIIKSPGFLTITR